MNKTGERPPHPTDGPSYVAIRALLAEAQQKLAFAAGGLLHLGHFDDVQSLVILIERLAKMHLRYEVHAESEARKEQASETRTPNCSVVPTRDPLGNLPPTETS